MGPRTGAPGRVAAVALAGEARDAGGGTPSISVCITTRRRERLLDRCLRDLKAQVAPPPFELLVCCQGETESAAVVREHFPDAVIGLVQSAHPGGARNFLLRHARGDVLLFLDDDITFPPHLLARLHELTNANPSVAVFGGPNLTPPESSTLQVVQGAVLGSILATGPVRRRYGRHPAGAADERFFTLCNMAVRRERMLPFPPALVCAEENAVLYELATELAKMHYDPDLYVYHERRETFLGFARQMKKYGAGRGQVIAWRPRSCRPPHLAAMLLPVWVVSLPVAAVLWTPWYLITGAAYLLAALAAGAGVAVSLPSLRWPRRLVAGALATGLTVAVHVCYGVGVLRGIVRRVAAPVSEWQPLSGLSHSSQLATDDAT